MGATDRGKEMAAAGTDLIVTPHLGIAILTEKTGRLLFHCTLLLARCTRTTTVVGGLGRVIDIEPGTLEGNANSTAENPTDGFSALRTDFQGVVHHLLDNLKTMFTCLTFILVCWHKYLKTFEHRLSEEPVSHIIKFYKDFVYIL